MRLMGSKAALALRQSLNTLESLILATCEGTGRRAVEDRSFRSREGEARMDPEVRDSEEEEVA